MQYARRFRVSWVVLVSLAILFTVVSNLAWNAQRTAALNDGFAEPDRRQPAIQTLPSVLTTIFSTATPTQSLVIIPGQVFDFPTATRTPTPINVGNFVWDDIDQDGRQDAGEPGLAGVTVQLWNPIKTQLFASTVTNASGNYTLVAPIPDQYRVRVVLPASGDQFSPKDQAGGDDTKDSDINTGGANLGFTDVLVFANNLISITTIDTGIIKFRTPTPTRTPTPVNVGNFVWDDIDHDGRQDAGEPGLAGVTVQIWNAAKTQLIDSAVTNASGAYTVVVPGPGQYRVRVVLPASGDQFSLKDQASGDDTKDSDINPTGSNLGFTDVLVFANNLISITTIDAGIIKFRTPTPTRTPTPINLGNFVWRDTDEDGRQDAGEPGLANVTVQLWNAAKTQLLASTTTSASGIYTLVAPLPGDYRIRVLLPTANDDFSPKNQAGGDDTKDSDINAGGLNSGFTDVFTIASNVISMTNIDAGIVSPALTFHPLTDVQLLLPTATPAPILAQPINACGGFRLTSPLDGLPNGVATFYWDPANVSATYQIVVMNEARAVLAVFSVSNTTSLSADVSQGAIGGGYQVIVQINAIINGQALCTDEHTILRAAPQFSAPPVLQIVPTATCRSPRAC